MVVSIDEILGLKCVYVLKPPTSDDVGECWPPFQGIKSWLQWLSCKRCCHYCTYLECFTWPKPCVTAFHDSQRFMISEVLTGISNRVHKCPAQDLQFLGQVGAYQDGQNRRIIWLIFTTFLFRSAIETADLQPNQWCLIEPCRARKSTWIRQNLIMSSVLSGLATSPLITSLSPTPHAPPVIDRLHTVWGSKKKPASFEFS